MTATLVLSGFKELQVQLENLKKATQKAVLQRSCIKAMEPMAEIARGLAVSENRSGEATGDLSRSIVVSTRAKGDTRDQGTAAYSSALRGGADRAGAVSAMRTAQRNASAGSYAKVYMGPLQARSAQEGAKQVVTEFGSFSVAPQPYMRPAWEQDHRAMMDRLRVIIGQEVQKTISRAAKRAATRAAKGA